MKYTQRIGAMLLAASLLFQGSVSFAFAEGVVDGTPSDLSEWTTPEASSVIEEPTATPEPEATATPEATDEPEATATPEVTDEPEATATPEATDEPEATATPEATDEPEATENPEATDEPEATENPEATDEPETTDEPEATETPAPDAWDESQCEHITLDCEQAPECEVEDCEHIALDAHGMEYPLCAAGRWLLDQLDGLGVMALSNAQKIVDLNRADATFYRSGEYALIGRDRTGAAVRIVRNRAAILELRGAAIDTLTVEAGAMVYIRVQDGMTATVNKLEILADATVIFSQGGTLKIDAVSCNGEISVEGASVNATMPEKTGRVRCTFAAPGVQNVLVEGENRTWYVTPDENGQVHLWLRPASEGMQWTPTLAEGTLMLRQTAKVPQTASGDVVQGQRNALKANMTYTLSGDVAEGTVLEIMESGVTVVLENVAFNGTLIEAGVAYDLIIRGDTMLDGNGNMPLLGSAPKVAVDGLLSVNGALPNGTKITSGVAMLSQPLDGWTSWRVDMQLGHQKVTLDGETLPLLMTANGELLLPEAPQGSTYAIQTTADEITVETVQQEVLTFTLTAENPSAEAGDAAEFIVNGSDAALNGFVHAAGTSATAQWRGVKLQGSQSVLRVENGTLHVNMTGDNALIADGMQPIALDNAQVTLNVESGRLVLRGQTSLDGVTLRGNVLVEPETAQAYVTITVRDAQGNLVSNQPVTLLLGEQKYRYTTHADGTLRLWGFGELDGTDLAVTDGETVYTAVIGQSSGEAVTGLEITDIHAADQEDGTLVITFQTNGAKTAGVQLYAGEAPASMPDTWRADAQRFAAEDGRVVISGLNPGDVVIFRVYASAAEDATLTAENADGFSFSEECFHVHRVKWTPSRTANTTYSATTYRPRMTLPETAKITYSGNQLVGGLPFYVGSYVMHVVIPEDDPLYLPGTVDVAFSIQKITLTICPDANQEKTEGEADPSRFTYTTSGLLEGDVLSGYLTRESGEEAGNYAFDISGLKAADYYTLHLMEDAPQFTILPEESGGWWWGGGGERLEPVQQTIERADGRKLFVTINTQEQLVLSYSELGSVVRNTADDQTRPFTPSLSWNKETDEVLLRISAEAELNNDSGYVTDSYGNPVYGARTLRLGYMSMKYMSNAGVDAICFSNKNAAVVLRLSDFLSEDMEKAVKQAGGSMTTTSFRITIEPVDLPDGAVEGGWNIRAEMYINRQYTDMSAHLPGAQVLVSVEPVAELLKSLDRYDEKTFPKLFALRRDGTQQESVFVAPYQDEELTLVDFPSAMFSSRYLTMPLSENGTVDIVMLSLPEVEEAETN